MALIYNKIVESNVEPSPNDLWLKDGKLKHYKGGWKDISGGASEGDKEPEVEYLYLPDIGITNDILSIQDLQLTPEQGKAIAEAKYIKAAPVTNYDDSSYNNIVILESPILSVYKSASFAGSGYYQVMYKIQSDQVDTITKNNEVITGYYRGNSNVIVTQDRGEEFIPTSISIGIVGNIVSVPTQQDLDNIEANVKAELKQVKKETLQGGSTYYTLPYYDEEQNTYNSRLYTVKVIDGNQVNVPLGSKKITLTTGTNLIQCNKLVDLHNVYGHQYWEVSVFDSTGNYSKQLVLHEARFGDYQLPISSDTSIAEGTEVEFFGTNKNRAR